LDRASGHEDGQTRTLENHHVLIKADARAIPLLDASVDCVVTSPPYFGLRDYGTAMWLGGDQACDHRHKLGGEGTASAKQNSSAGTQMFQYTDICRKCGAIRVDQQIGLEPSPSAYVDTLVGVFRELWRVLKDDGTVWLNLGDSYYNCSPVRTSSAGAFSKEWDPSLAKLVGGKRRYPDKDDGSGLKMKDLIGIPWRVAFALQDDGWYLRSDIIWHKPNPMPESVTDRPTKSHEYLFLLAKSERYCYDADAIKEPSTGQSGSAASFKRTTKDHVIPNQSVAQHREDRDDRYDSGYRNKRSVWTVATMPYSGAHFATMPEKLVEPCILAGCSAGGLVLDPFVGSGTVVSVAQRLGRRGVGIDLSYQDLARERTAQRGLMFT
jgi:DNA modification methylase